MLSIYDLFLTENTSEKLRKTESTDEIVKEFFPSFISSISGNLQTIFPILTDHDKSSSKQFNSHIQNLKTSVYYNEMPQPNAYTIPAIQTNLGAQLVGLRPFTFVYLIYGFAKLKKSQLDAKPSGKSIVFQNKNNINMLMWHTRGLKDMLPEERLRHAVYLHEIGHWVKFKPVFASLSARILNSAFPAMAVPFTILDIAFARSGEWKADKFAADMGYKKELGEALHRIGYTVRTNTNLYTKFNDYFRFGFTKIHNTIDKFLPITGHPSMRKRTQRLEEVMFEGKIKDKLSDLFKPMDELLAKNAKQLFPLAR